MHGDDLVVLALFVAHGHDADRARAQDAERHHRLLTEHKHVERVAVLAVGLREEAVVRRVVHGRVQHAVQPQQARALVELVLHLRALGDLDDRAEVTLDVVAQLDIVPRVHSTADDTLRRGAPRLRRGAPSGGGLGGHVGAPMKMDEFEEWFDKGVTDGLPVVPPTRARVEAMLAATHRARDELLGEMPPNYGRVTVEKAAVNAVMAGCRPEYLPVLIAATECACEPAFNLHGVSTSTHFSAPLMVVHGPVRQRIGLNCSFGVVGPGYRANATLRRALRLLMINVGGSRPGEISMSTFGHPGRYTYCIGEHEEASPWPPYHVARGLSPGSSAVTLFAGEAPDGI